MVFKDNADGKFNLKYTHVKKKQFFKFMLMMAKNGDVGRICQKLVDSFEGFLDLYSSISECLEKNDTLSHDNMVGPLTYLFKCRDDNVNKEELRKALMQQLL
jgi:hypothetical protein